MCVYCAEEKATTIDHVPPKGLFAKGNRQHLVRVPSCKGCNSGFSRDDEYFRQTLHLRKDVFHLPEAQEARDSTLRALGREDHRGLRAATVRNTSFGEKWYGGVYLGVAQYLTYSAKRTGKVASRIVYALWSEGFGHRLPPEYLCFAFETVVWEQAGAPPEHYLVDLPSAHVTMFLDEKRVCFVAVEQNAYDPYTTRWFIGFYGKVFFAGFTVPKAGINEDVLDYIREVDWREASE